MSSAYPLPMSDLKSLGFATKPIEHLDDLIRSHIHEGRYPGAQIALARHGQLALLRTYGDDRIEGGTRAAAARLNPAMTALDANAAADALAKAVITNYHTMMMSGSCLNIARI